MRRRGFGFFWKKKSASYGPGELQERARRNIARQAQELAKRGDCRSARSLIKDAGDSLVATYARERIAEACSVGSGLGRYRAGVMAKAKRKSRRPKRR